MLGPSAAGLGQQFEAEMVWMDSARSNPRASICEARVQTVTAEISHGLVLNRLAR